MSARRKLWSKHHSPDKCGERCILVNVLRLGKIAQELSGPPFSWVIMHHSPPAAFAVSNEVSKCVHRVISALIWASSWTHQIVRRYLDQERAGGTYERSMQGHQMYSEGVLSSAWDLENDYSVLRVHHEIATRPDDDWRRVGVQRRGKSRLRRKT